MKDCGGVVLEEKVIGIYLLERVVLGFESVHRGMQKCFANVTCRLRAILYRQM